MNKMYLMVRLRCSSSRILNVTQAAGRCYRSSSSNDSKDDNSSVENKDEKKAKEKEVNEKLHALLRTISKENAPSQEKPSIELAKPKNKRNLKKTSDSEADKQEPFEKQILSAAKTVAENLGGDTKKTESELLSKLLNVSKENNVAASLGELIKGMKIEREPKPTENQSRAQQVQQLLDMAKSKRQPGPSTMARLQQRPTGERKSLSMPLQKIDLFGGTGLGIFTSEKDVPATEGVVNKTWNQLYEKELHLAVTHPPANYFQQMILWTEQKKIWQFPIDNEQGMDEEHKVYFTEHVFLEKHLEPWCPSKGPVRHFMELVCVGLSKNPYMTVETKKGHIEWYKNYFEERKQLLRDIGAIPTDKAKVSEIKES